LRKRHKRLFQNDPYYSPNLSYERPYDIAFPPRRDKPWRKYARRSGGLRVLMLSNLDRAIEDEPVLELQAHHLTRLGHEVFIGSPHARPSMSHEACQFVRLHHPIEAAAYAVANDIDCIVVHTSPFFSVVRWIGDWPRCILCDYGEQEAVSVEDADLRRRQEVERQFCLGVADRVFTIPEGLGERARGGEANLSSEKSLAEFAALLGAACRS
jgi:hypothetical protein